MSRFAAAAGRVIGATRLRTQQAAGTRLAAGGGLQNIIKQMQAAQRKANLANEQRYQQILSSFEGLGKAGRARIEQQTIQRQAEATQQLTSRGLGGTTITSAVERGIAGQAETQRQQLEESVTMQRAGVMERRTDVGPDLGMFASLLQAAGQQQAPQRRATITRMAPRGPGILSQWKAQQVAGTAAIRAKRAVSQGARYYGPGSYGRGGSRMGG